ncbi:hypothetical protein N9X87_00020 [bacterium]|nr:hypothetical protein [bacterium]
MIVITEGKYGPRSEFESLQDAQTCIGLNQPEIEIRLYIDDDGYVFDQDRDIVGVDTAKMESMSR